MMYFMILLYREGYYIINEWIKENNNLNLNIYIYKEIEQLDLLDLFIQEELFY